MIKNWNPDYYDCYKSFKNKDKNAWDHFKAYPKTYPKNNIVLFEFNKDPKLFKCCITRWLGKMRYLLEQ